MASSKKTSTIDIEARSRAGSLHRIRKMLAYRNEAARHPYTSAAVCRGLLREEIAHLRLLGPGPVEPLETISGRFSVPETQWGGS